MYSAHKIFRYHQKSEGGFVLVVAIMAVMILMAVGFFILTTTTQDVRMSTRLVGERQALSAAEACVHFIAANLSPTSARTFTNVAYDMANNPNARFSSNSVPNLSLSNMAAPGYSLSNETTYGQGFDTVCVGRETGYGSSASIGIGTTGPIGGATLQYPYN